ncbi:MAG: DUF4976 domain-containing protein, partial [Acidobacteria bacterium]|nr:DUF4976 domain-containing protein [Acidobacteriota bacterium]
AFCYLLDLFPTLCDFAGLPVPSSVDGHSLMPLVRDPKARIRNTLFHAYINFQRAVRAEDWKLILCNVEGQRHTQLFDLRNDPMETKNLAGDPRHKSRVADLTAVLRQQMREAQDPMDVDKPDWGTQALLERAGRK